MIRPAFGLQSAPLTAGFQTLVHQASSVCNTAISLTASDDAEVLLLGWVDIRDRSVLLQELAVSG